MFVTKTLKVEEGHIAQFLKLDIKHCADKKIVCECADQAAVLKKIAGFVKEASENPIVSLNVQDTQGEIQYMDGDTKKYIQYEVKPD